MQTATVRRLLAGAAGLAIGLAGMLAAAGPAQAVEALEPEATFFPSCDGMNVVMFSGSAVDWSVTRNDESVWPGEGDTQPEPGEANVVFVPASAGDVIGVTYQGAGEGWPQTREMEEPGRLCELLPEPAVTQPTCDQPGTITIPDFTEFLSLIFRTPPSAEVGSIIDQEPPPTEAPPTVDPRTEPEHRVLLDGVEVEDGSTHEVEPGTHTVEFSISFDGLFYLTLKLWTVEIVAADCPDEPEEPGDEPEEPGDEPGAEDGGEAGELPKTGTPAVLIAGAAAALLLVGGALYLVARRRRTTFTA